MSRSVVIMGAGVAGLSAAVLLARDGHDVTILDGDALDAGSPDEAMTWERHGVPHFLQPHAVIPRGRKILREQLPDVYADLLGAGATEIDARRKLPGGAGPQDDDLQYVAVRRPLVEWALRRAVHREAGIAIRAGTRATGVRIDRGRVQAVVADSVELPADLVVDAMGRRTPSPRWLAEAGGPATQSESSDCGAVYYTRYYRQRDDFELPDGAWVLGPRGDLGYMGFSTFPGDNRTFAVLILVPTGTTEWRALKDNDAFDAAVAHIPQLTVWVNRDHVDPITDVMAMGGLRNTLRDCATSVDAGIVPVGDAYAHTDPFLAHGLVFGLIHACELVAALRHDADLRDVGANYLAKTAPALAERYAFATALDDERRRHWLGEHVDFAHRDGAYALFSVVAAGAAGLLDAEIFRTSVRRLGLLDSTSVLDDDVELQLRIEAIFAQLRSKPQPSSGPSKAAMLQLLADSCR